MSRNSTNRFDEIEIQEWRKETGCSFSKEQQKQRHRSGTGIRPPGVGSELITTLLCPFCFVFRGSKGQGVP